MNCGRKEAENSMVKENKCKILLTCSGFGKEETEQRFGIAALDEKTGESLVFPDISTRQEIAEEFISRCVRCDLSFTHIPDCLEDYLDEIFTEEPGRALV